MNSNFAKRAIRGLGRRLNPAYFRFRSFVNNRVLLAHAPYPLRHFTDLLDRINRSQHDELCDFDSFSSGGKSRRWYVRHDIDTPDCLLKAPLLLEAGLKARVRAGVFLRVRAKLCGPDGVDVYRLREARELVSAFKSKGVSFGVHSECYLDDDWRGRLRHEVDTFQDVLGFSPACVNAHGYGTYRQDVRQRFYADMTKQTLAGLGIGFSDCGNSEHNYNLIIQDCNHESDALNGIDFRLRRRVLLSDFAELPPLGWANSFLILTHPMYWVR